jgi:flagellar biosynthesis/type III secretory pathway protein FliH
VTALSEWLRAPEQIELRRSLTTWVVQVLLRARAPGAEIPELTDLTDLEEVKSMLAERVTEWTREWKQEGFEEGLAKVRAALIRELERHFGPLPTEARQRVESLDSGGKIVELSIASATATSLAALGLY